VVVAVGWILASQCRSKDTGPQHHEEVPIHAEELGAENLRLIYEVDKLKDAAVAESLLKRDAEEAANQLKAMFDIANLEKAALVLEKLKSSLPSIVK
jgi:hypothetical protein